MKNEQKMYLLKWEEAREGSTATVEIERKELATPL